MGVESRWRRDWASVPLEILQLISSRLTNIDDFIRFRCVCAWWRFAADPKDFTHPQLPRLLMLPYRADVPIALFYNPISHHVSSMDLPEARGKWVYASAYGWLVLVKEEKHYQPNFYTFTLMHGITRALIHIPARLKKERELFPFAKVLLCSNPASAQPGQLLLAALSCRDMVLYTQGNPYWTVVKLPGVMGDIVHFNNQIYLVDSWGRLMVIDASSKLRLLINSDSSLPKYFHCPKGINLLDVDGNLLLLVRVDRFHVFKLDRTSNGVEFKWTNAIEGIGNNTLHASNYQSVTISCSGDSGITNKIYFFGGETNRNGSKYLMEMAERSQVLDIVDGVTTSTKEEVPPYGEEEYRILHDWGEDWMKASFAGLTWIVPSLC